MKIILTLGSLLLSMCAFSLWAQPQLEHEIQNAQTGLPNWIPQVGSMDYDGDGNAEMFLLEYDDSDLRLIVQSSADPNAQWIFSWNEYCPQVESCEQNIQFLGFFDFNGDGTHELLLGKRNSPIIQKGYSHLAIITDSNDDDSFFSWPGRVLKDIRDWDNDGVLELVLQNQNTGSIELWGQ